MINPNFCNTFVLIKLQCTMMFFFVIYNRSKLYAVKLINERKRERDENFAKHRRRKKQEIKAQATDIV